MLQKMQEQEASSLYGELLGRIGSHHVDEPDFRQLVERGCLAMETALDDPGFLGFVGVAPSAERIRFCASRLPTSSPVGRSPPAATPR